MKLLFFVCAILLLPNVFGIWYASKKKATTTTTTTTAPTTTAKYDPWSLLEKKAPLLTTTSSTVKPTTTTSTPTTAQTTKKTTAKKGWWYNKKEDPKTTLTTITSSTASTTTTAATSTTKSTLTTTSTTTTASTTTTKAPTTTTRKPTTTTTTATTTTATTTQKPTTTKSTTKPTTKPAELAQSHQQTTYDPEFLLAVLLSKMEQYRTKKTATTTSTTTTTTTTTTRPKSTEVTIRTYKPRATIFPRNPGKLPNVYVPTRRPRPSRQNHGNLPEQCTKPPKRGSCGASLNAWYFDATVGQKRCKYMRYRVCQGNANRFPTREACENFCIDRQIDPCNTATCPRNAKCVAVEDFTCRREKSADCPPKYAICRYKNWPTTIFQPVYDSSAQPQECRQPVNVGSCYGRRRPLMKFYYVPALRDCKRFYFSGCGGNDNRFNSKDECMDHCG